ncbi:nuclear transport factor 2 family protein [Pontixanthobacter aquaemixtae]|uniref:SnoaL-like domain-containing protein n=1 Tax=Pontixanthobacter aquaemixtae TaxID=1958940 RepID=A0A844ZWB1_9SPHN|nr:nuclear transport factor 2 family protein [Pontixanthobacter aquaemixtae]MXO91734.1 hypothetical protein [Pontixanthobacter aquaemixtae]
MRNFVSLGLAAALVVSALHGSESATARESSIQETTVSKYVAAYNIRDLELMRSMMHAEIQWIAIEGGNSEIVANGRDALAEQMQSYFASPTKIWSAFDDVIENGRFLTLRETAHWQAADGTVKSQSSIVVYEFEDALIRRVWYYSAQN